MVAMPEVLLRGKPYPLGAAWDGFGTNFAVFSAHATRMELCVFDAAGRKELRRMVLPECTQHVWHGYLPEAHPGLLYGYRAHGDWDPLRGHVFNPNKLLIDPYARQLYGRVRWSDALFPHRLGGPEGKPVLDRRNSASAMPKCVVTDEAFHWADDQRPQVPWHRTVIYETHVRGFSQLRQDIHPALRGRFAALATPQAIEHFRGLGVTTLELMPVQAFLQDRQIVERGLRNYWGYSPLSYFAPEADYLGAGGLDEIRRAVRRLHLAGIEVILDVVYNHTCEADELGPSLSFRGLDNASYYRLSEGECRRAINDTGCGNSLNVAHPRVMQMVLDSLRYWASAFHVDGFRFDLGTTLGRRAEGFDRAAAFFQALQQDPLLGQLKLISEPWDVGPGGYQLGNQPAIFAEWNDRYRDSVRRFWRGDAGERSEFARRISGSADIFDRDGRRPWASVQFVTAHDGFTLEDLVSYAHKHNQGNGEQNRDGAEQNYSANWGEEGPSAAPAILQVRRRIKRSMLATLWLSIGTPMLLGGDELGNSQGGNNNAYCQDNAISWLDWPEQDDAAQASLLRFCRVLGQLRRRHRVFQCEVFPHGRLELLPGIRDLEWFDADGNPMTVARWQDPAGQVLAARRAAHAYRDRRAPASAEEPVEIALLLFNGSAQNCVFRLPEPRLPWRRVLSTGEEVSEEQELGAVVEHEVAAHGMVVLMCDCPSGAPGAGSSCAA